jgi:hypothetical protein
MVIPADVKAARLRMLEARKMLENYEKLKGFAMSLEHKRLTNVFSKSADVYLRISTSH